MARRGATFNNGFGMAAAAQGLADGLQFSEGIETSCKSAMDTTILSSNYATEGLKTFYNPTSWAVTMQYSKELIDSTAGIASYCNVNKLIDNITKAVGEGLSTTIARVGGGLINELPAYYTGYINAANDY
jgi:hypothetical protein